MTQSSREIEAREKAEVVTEDTRPGLVFRPDVDILERSDAFVIHADMPGANEDTVEINLDKGVLTLDGRIEEAPTGAELEENEAAATPILRHAEYQVGNYHREFRISKDIDVDAVSARMKDGVLELTLPKTAEVQPRRIAIEAA